jgi:hypothetical protein
VRKAADSSHGVEFAAVADGERIQARVVRFGVGNTLSTSARDEDMEKMWCSEYERLQNLIRETGGSVNLEKALAPGATPVKVIEGASEIGPSRSISTKRRR